MQKRFRHQAEHRLLGVKSFRHSARGAVGLADFAAATLLRSLLRRPGDLLRLQRQAAACADDDPPSYP